MDAHAVVVTIAFADLSGFTALTEAHGDMAGLDAAVRFYGIAERCLCSTRIVKHIGDAVMLAGRDSADVIETCLRVSEAVVAEPLYPSVRIGIHTGPALEREGDYVGAAVNLAARVAGVARAAQTLCTAEVLGCAAASDRFAFRSLGAFALKNIPHQVPLFEVQRVQSVGAALDICVTDPVCRMRIEPTSAIAKLVVDGRWYCFCSQECASKFALDPGQYAGS